MRAILHALLRVITWRTFPYQMKTSRDNIGIIFIRKSYQLNKADLLDQIYYEIISNTDSYHSPSLSNENVRTTVIGYTLF